MDKTLEELRAENAAAEAAKSEAPQTTDEGVTDGAAADLNADENLAEGEEGKEGTQAEPESWMQSDDQESQGADKKAGEKKFTDSDVGAAKAKVRAKLEAKHQTEMDELRAALEELRRNTVAPQQTARPKREDFYDRDDPDDAYTEALADWKLKETLGQQQQQQQQYEMQRNQLDARQKIESGVDQHYERAARLAAERGISPELYQSADHRVRSAIDGVFPGGGENVANSLIASLGEGSEKVFYNLGVNPKRLAELTARLAADPTGLQASIYLGKLSAELTVPVRKASNAPAPATTVHGDANTADAGKNLQKRYAEAHRRGDTQAAFDIRREAKAKKINVSSW